MEGSRRPCVCLYLKDPAQGGLGPPWTLSDLSSSQPPPNSPVSRPWGLGLPDGFWGQSAACSQCLQGHGESQKYSGLLCLGLASAAFLSSCTHFRHFSVDPWDFPSRPWCRLHRGIISFFLAAHLLFFAFAGGWDQALSVDVLAVFPLGQETLFHR